MAPELFEETGRPSFASDLWALACVLVETFTGKPPSAGTCKMLAAEFYRARSRLDRRQFLQPNTHFAAFFEIYKISNPLHQSKLIIFLLKIIIKLFLIIIKNSAKFSEKRNFVTFLSFERCKSAEIL